MNSEGPIRTLADLNERLSRLPAVAAGYTRVYRGQSKAFGPIRPTGLRSPDILAHSWRAYAVALADDILDSADAPQRPLGFEIWTRWAEALAQHYGPGSRYLDVTRSLGVALWFALHVADSVEVIETIGPVGPPNPKDVAVASIWVNYRANNEPGLLLVFDAPVQSEPGKEEHGQVVDLAQAPDIFANSSRIQAQHACLLSADPAMSGGDLSSFLACPPIAIGWPMTGANDLRLATEEMFPQPSRDDWYARLLSIPLGFRLDATGQNLELTRTMPVPVYMPATSEHRAEISQLTTRVEPDLIYSTIVSHAPAWTTLDPKSDEGLNIRLDGATRIVVEMPLSVLMPPSASQMWNHGVLCSDLDESVEALSLQGVTRSVPLNNVLVQFSPLEKVGWERLERPGYSMEIVRAIWMITRLPHIAVELFIEAFPQREFVGARLFFRFESSTARLLRWSPNADNWEVAGSAPVDKPVFATLTILRDLSSALKPTPFPKWALSRAEGDWAFMVGVAGVGAKLREGVERQTGITCWTLRDAKEDRPFVGRPVERIVEFESPQAWCDVDAEWLHELINRKSDQKAS